MRVPKEKHTRKIYAVTNQKGGVGKTTTAINLATTLVAIGHRVLVMDLDSQGNASTGLGVYMSDRAATTYDLFTGEKRLDDVFVPVKDVEGLFLAPATTDLSSVDVDFVNDRTRLLKVKEAIAGLTSRFDYILIDCPPSLNLLTLNALAASDGVLVPLQSEYYALEGLSLLLTTIKEVKAAINPNLSVRGIVLTMYDKRNNLSVQVEEDVRNNLGALVFETIIPRNVRLSEAPSFAIPALLYDPKSAGSVAYQELAAELLSRELQDG